MSNLKKLYYAVMFLFIFQIFYYIKDSMVLYALAKAVIPAFIALFTYFLVVRFFYTRKAYPFTGLIIFFFVYLISVSALASHFYFKQSLLYGVAAQVKLLPMLFFFYVYYLLETKKLNMESVSNYLIYWGLISLVVYVLINVLVNPAAVWTKESSIVVNDAKGYRFRLPEPFILIALFYFFRKYFETYSLKSLILFTAFALYMIVFHKQRLLLLSASFVLYFVSLKNFKMHTRVLVTGLLSVLTIGVFLLLDTYQNLLTGEDTSYLARVHTITIAFDFLRHGLVQLLFGAGNLNLYNYVNFNTLYGQNFWLSDIGWLGLTFEFGLIGSFMLAYLFYLILKAAGGLDERAPLILFALRDYLIAMLIVSVIAPRIAYLSGISMSILAIFAYYKHHGESALPAV